MGSCRHGVILCAANMKTGENYRLVHCLQKEAWDMNVKFFCYDVVCRFQPFSENVSRAFDEFSSITESMQPFLSRMHGKTHHYACQVCNNYLFVYDRFYKQFLFQTLAGKHWIVQERRCRHIWGRTRAS